MASTLALVLSLLLAPALCAGADAARSQVSFTARPALGYDALMRSDPRWLGGDGFYSVALDEARTLWVFGDSWLADGPGSTRKAEPMLHNTLAVQQGWGPGPTRIEFFSGPHRDGQRTSSFEPPEPGTFYWPLAPVAHGGKLWLLLRRLRAPEGWEGMSFTVLDTDLVTVENPEDDPPAWRWTRQRLPWDERRGDRELRFGSAALEWRGFVYVYGYQHLHGRPPNPGARGTEKDQVLARVPRHHLGDFDLWRFWDGAGWRADPYAAAPLFPGAATELSVDHVPGVGFVMVQSVPTPPGELGFRVAAAPTGPFSRLHPVQGCPEASLADNYWCYAGKAAARPTPGGLLVGWVSNSLGSFDFVTDTRIYAPRFLELGFPARSVPRR